MAIHLRKTHNLPREQVREIVEQIAQDLAHDLHLNYSWDGDKLHFHRTGIHGHIAIEDGALEVFMKKSFLLPVSEKWLQEQVESYFQRYLAND